MIHADIEANDTQCDPSVMSIAFYFSGICLAIGFMLSNSSYFMNQNPWKDRGCVVLDLCPWILFQIFFANFHCGYNLGGEGGISFQSFIFFALFH